MDHIQATSELAIIIKGNILIKKITGLENATKHRPGSWTCKYHFGISNQEIEAYASNL